MTLKEKVAEMIPEAISHIYVCGVTGCPTMYDFLNATNLCTHRSDADKSLCKKCWNREFVEEEKEENGNAVDHPAHYQGKRECIEVMRALFGDRAVMDFCKLNSYKYRFRADKKNGDEDIKKAEWYEDYLIKMQEEQEEKRKSDGAW